MSQKDDLLANVEDIQKGLKKLGDNRVVALSVHKSKELIAELEEKAEKLVQQVSAL
ncbi:MAG: phosphoribosylformylglycinamidine (FGAM) synthase PurS component [Granulosicoccus sp.]|jgi:phosphoribosylformylglycinamidine (FGAM) synthase PurS component